MLLVNRSDVLHFLRSIFFGVSSTVMVFYPDQGVILGAILTAIISLLYVVKGLTQDNLTEDVEYADSLKISKIEIT
jgi:hypothetical protein